MFKLERCHYRLVTTIGVKLLHVYALLFIPLIRHILLHRQAEIGPDCDRRGNVTVHPRFALRIGYLPSVTASTCLLPSDGMLTVRSGRVDIHII